MNSDHSVYVQNIFNSSATHSEQYNTGYIAYNTYSIYSKDPAVKSCDHRGERTFGGLSYNIEHSGNTKEKNSYSGKSFGLWWEYGENGLAPF